MMRTMKFLYCVSLALLLIAPLNASNTRSEELYSQIKCPICNGQTIGDSESALARDMRHTIDRMINEGKDDEYIKEFFRTRYGDDVVLDPKLDLATLWLWLLPLLFALVGIIYCLRRLRSTVAGRP